MRVLFIGGTGEISSSCVLAATKAGHHVTVLNRGCTAQASTLGAEFVHGDIFSNAPYAGIAEREFDVVCQFLAFEPGAIARDIEAFAGRCAQYIFISTASAYEKPTPRLPITEETPTGNPYMAYSRNKAACEVKLEEAFEAKRFPITIVRPSHTYRKRLPSTVIHGDHLAWRLLRGKKILVHGDGESLWTLTHSDDFARAFIALFGRASAIGESFNITDDQAQTWNHILNSVADAIGESAEICPVSSRKLISYAPEWEGPLLGDKSNSLVFNTRKLRNVIGDWRCEISLSQGIKDAWLAVQKRLVDGYQPDSDLDALIDRILQDCGYE